MITPKYKFASKGNYIQGEFRPPADPNGEWTHKSPADFTDHLGTFRYSYADVDRAVDSARTAYKTWRLLSVQDRADYLKRYQAALKGREAELSEAIAREVGKPLWEAKTEVSAMVNKVDVSINEGFRPVTDFTIDNILPDTRGVCHYRPLGVLAVIGPFNFPGHLANGHIVPALLFGNTVVFKPSEKTPLSGQLMAECFEEAGLPMGVFNVIQGEKEVGRRLAVHEGVSGILFTGSYEVGTRIKQDTLQQHWKLLALEMGGKNPAIVWKDADLDAALRETLVGAYLTTGQRCSATSRILVHKDLFAQFLELFHKRAKSFVIGHPLQAYETGKPEPFMGALIDSGTVDRYMKFQGIAQREGCELVMRGKQLDEGAVGYKGHYVSPSICWVQDPTLEATKKSVYQQTELFAPNVALLEVSDLEEAIAQANATQYGLVASVFSRDEQVFHKCWQDLEFGLVNWNKSTVGASSRLPFGGFKKSGNHFPTAATAGLYCTHPIASLEVRDPKPGAGGYPGLSWE